MSRFWSFYFLLMPLAVLAVFAIAPFFGWTFPEGVSRVGDDIDFIYRVVLFITGTVFLGTQFFLCYALVRYRDQPGREAWYTHGNKKAEAIWTVIPAAAIAGIAALQMPTWRKMQETPKAGEPILARVVGHRFEWRVIHAGPDGKLDTADDVVLTNQLHLPPGKRVWIELRSDDVIHSFYLPHFRVKQDTVPGMKITMALDARTRSSEWRERNAGFVETDLENYDAFAKLLRQANRPVDKMVRQEIDRAGSWEILERYDPKSPGFEPFLESGVVRALNAVIEKGDLDADQAFKDVARSKATKALLDRAAKANKREAWRRTINRALVADAYPGIVRRLQKDLEILCAELCGEGHFQMHGKVVVHDDEADFEAWLKEAQTGDPQESGR